MAHVRTATPEPDLVIEHGDQSADTPDLEAVADRLSDPDWLTGQVRHRSGCPVEGAPWTSEDQDVVVRSVRMEASARQEPRTTENPYPATVTVARCIECGNEARFRASGR